MLSAEPFTLDPSCCGFAVQVSFPAGKEFAKELKAPDGTMIFLVTGTLKVSLTNPQTGKTITENVSGPAKTTVFPDGSITTVATGRTVSFFAPADAARFGLPAVNVTSGRLTESFDSNGALTALSLNGHVSIDVCAALS